MANSLSLESKYLAKIVLTHQKVLGKFVYTICLKKNLNDVEKKITIVIFKCLGEPCG